MKPCTSPLLNCLVRYCAKIALCLSCLRVLSASGAETAAQLKDLSIEGGLNDGKARLVIEAFLGGLLSAERKELYSTTVEHQITAFPDRLEHALRARFEILEGEPRELLLTLNGTGTIRAVTGELLQDWSVRQETNKVLVLRPRKADRARGAIEVNIRAEQPLTDPARPVTVFSVAPPQSALFHGYVVVQAEDSLAVQPEAPAGLTPVENEFLPDSLRVESSTDSKVLYGYRFQGAAYSLKLRLGPADPEARTVGLSNFRLNGHLTGEQALFTLHATARVKNPQGASIELLAGDIGLTDFKPNPDWQIKLQNRRFILHCSRPGEFAVELKFAAAVRESNGWKQVNFRVAPSALQPITLSGLPEETMFEFAGAARPERAGAEFSSFLPPDGNVSLAWKERRPDAEGRLFYAAEMISQISVAPGLLTQEAELEIKVMQGELSGLELLLRGPGEITRVQGQTVLAWKVESIPNTQDRRLVIQLNQPQKDRFEIQTQLQTPLGPFPQTVDATHLRPDGATRFGGHLRVVNEGAVRLEIVQASGLSQISPDQFPQTKAGGSLFRTGGTQRFAYRFSGGDFALRIGASQIAPEVSVSQVLLYHLGESDHSVDVELELDIREAPLREVLLRIPKGYAVARLNVPGLSDYFVRDNPAEPDADLRLVYGQPVAGRQVIQARLERNQALNATNWVLPRIEVAQAKSTRGHIGVSSDPAFRLTPQQLQGLTEIAAAFFPRKAAGLQMAYRLSDPGWQATVGIERLPQTVQADALHLFSIGEGIAYGSTILNYVVSSATVSTFQVELSDEYSNVEFTGKDIRGWQKGTNSYSVQLHSPVSGTYTLLATYERPFRPSGESLNFTGARPLDAQLEQGYAIVLSGYQFRVDPAEVSPSLLALEPGEVPAEYRLLFDAPILAAYRYSSRPFNLRLTLSPIAQGDTLSQVVDRASFHTRISKAGQVLTDVQYFLKNRGHPNLRIALPSGTQLWSSSVNGTPVVPVTDRTNSLIPLPQHLDANSLLRVDLQLAAPSNRPGRIRLAAPTVNAPVMLAEWKVTADTGQRLVYRSGSLTPQGGPPDSSGFAQLARLFTQRRSAEAVLALVMMVVLLALASAVWRWAGRPGVYRYSLRHLAGITLGLAAFLGAVAWLFYLNDLARSNRADVPRELTFLVPVQQASAALSVEVGTAQAKTSVLQGVLYAWPAVLALMVWLYAAVRGNSGARSMAWVVGWLLLAWAALRWPNGVPMFLILIGTFLIVQVAAPALTHLTRLPGRQPSAPPAPAASPQASAAVLIILCTVLSLSWSSPVLAEQLEELVPQAHTNSAEPKANERIKRPARQQQGLAQSVRQQITVTNGFVESTVRIQWSAEKGQRLPLLYQPAVLTQVSFPTNSLQLVSAPDDAGLAQQLFARESATIEIQLTYQLHATERHPESGFTLPTSYGLVNEVSLFIPGLDVQIGSPQAVTVQQEFARGRTQAKLILGPVERAWIGWKPRSRDLSREALQLYADVSQLYVPSAGIIEGLHHVGLRPAQGVVSELTFTVPTGLIITDVFDPAAFVMSSNQTSSAATKRALVSHWRFDPDARKLRVSLQPTQSRPFSIWVRSQIPTGALPIRQPLGLISLDGAAGQPGVVGIATGNEVQLDNVIPNNLAPLNLEDFPAAALVPLQAQVAGLTLRRAYRYTDTTGTVDLSASAVQPDVRVETHQTLSLGEDRTLLAINAALTIARAGIFQLSFTLPPGFDVDTISGEALSHWTQSQEQGARVVTLHLKGKTEGNTQLTLALSGPGASPIPAWPVPQWSLREASKQRGTLLIVPEQALRVQVSAREGVTQLDPEKSGVKQKGVLAFRLLQTPWQLAINIEQVDPWIQVTSLQHATVNEAQIKVGASFQYQIENTGLKAFRILLPTDAEGVRFEGDQVADFRTAGTATNGMQGWEIKLHRRMLGSYSLQVSYQTRLPAEATQALIRGLEAADVNLHRGYLSVHPGGRLQVRADAVPSALQPVDWQSVPRALQRNLPTAPAHLTFRTIEPGFQLNLILERHPAAKLLEARITHVNFNSVISDNGAMLTQVRLEMQPGDKRLLHLTLPAGARFWFAFVNQTAVWPWREQDRVLIPLESQSPAGETIAVEFFYSNAFEGADPRSLQFEVHAPRFDLPLEDVVWRVHLNEKWRLEDWSGSLQFDNEQFASGPPSANLPAYLQNEESARREQTREAEQMLALGNSALERGDPHRARRAFQAAYGLSQGDRAFNEDARVQLNNLKIQQAVVGLNVRQEAVSGKSSQLADQIRELSTPAAPKYSQQDVQALTARQSAEENAAFMKVAQRLVQQQEAAVNHPAPIRTSVPAGGRVLTFKRAIVVDTWADLAIRVTAQSTQLARGWVRLIVLFSTFLLLVAGLAAARWARSRRAV